jgi:hypothetical protein
MRSFVKSHRPSLFVALVMLLFCLYFAVGVAIFLLWDPHRREEVALVAIMLSGVLSYLFPWAHITETWFLIRKSTRPSARWHWLPDTSKPVPEARLISDSEFGTDVPMGDLIVARTQSGNEWSSDAVPPDPYFRQTMFGRRIPRDLDAERVVATAHPLREMDEAVTGYEDDWGTESFASSLMMDQLRRRHEPISADVYTPEDLKQRGYWIMLTPEVEEFCSLHDIARPISFQKYRDGEWVDVEEVFFRVVDPDESTIRLGPVLSADDVSISE